MHTDDVKNRLLEYMKEFPSFLVAVGIWWVLVLGGVGLTVLSMFVTAFVSIEQPGNELVLWLRNGRSYLLTVAIVALLVGVYKAWFQEHSMVKHYQAEIDRSIS
ncbi:MAG: hypothetical protein MN733_22330 [Nitrososphaera sp.]|nr:hypothetical protein [Nitrososphaera sp.]